MRLLTLAVHALVRAHTIGTSPITEFLNVVHCIFQIILSCLYFLFYSTWMFQRVLRFRFINIIFLFPLQFRNFKIVYRRYAGLYFCICVDIGDNNLAYLEAIHNFVEVIFFLFLVHSHLTHCYILSISNICVILICNIFFSLWYHFCCITLLIIHFWYSATSWK